MRHGKASMDMRVDSMGFHLDDSGNGDKVMQFKPGDKFITTDGEQAEVLNQGCTLDSYLAKITHKDGTTSRGIVVVSKSDKADLYN